MKECKTKELRFLELVLYIYENNYSLPKSNSTFGQFIRKHRTWNPIINLLNLVCNLGEEDFKESFNILVKNSEFLLNSKKYDINYCNYLEIKQFVETNKRFPKSNVKAEICLYAKLNRLKRLNYLPIIELYSDLNRKIETRPASRTLNDNLNLYIEFKRKNNREPSIYSEDREERFLYRWKIRNKTYITEKLNILEEKFKIESIDEGLDQFKKFCELNYRLPLTSKGGYEAYLYRWIKRNKSRNLEIHNTFEYYSQKNIKLREYMRVCLRIDRLPSASIFDEYLLYYKYAITVLTRTRDNKKLRNFIDLFNLYKEGDLKAIKVINLLKEKLGID